MKDISIDTLKQRAEILRAIRKFFDERDFIEVETAVRISAPAPEEHIDCPPMKNGGFLRASPELQMKKLLALGMERIYQIGPCFREGEKGLRHNPEFTMIEWYRRDEDYRKIMQDMTDLMSRIMSDAEEDKLAKIVQVREAYREFAGWDPWELWDQDRFDFDMATKIEPAIKQMGGGVFLTDYPLAAASLARARGDVAERWEYYWNGMELANCFTELCDREEQLGRFEKARAARKALNEADYPIDMEFIDSLPLIGSAAGVALGVDRLVMVALAKHDIAAVRAVE